MKALGIIPLGAGIFLLATIPASFAAECGIIKRLRTSATQKFNDIRGETARNGHIRPTFVMLEGNCRLTSMDSDTPDYKCSWYVSRDEGPAKKAYETLISTTQACLSSRQSADRYRHRDGKGETATLIDENIGTIDISYGYFSTWWTVDFTYAVTSR